MSESIIRRVKLRQIILPICTREQIDSTFHISPNRFDLRTRESIFNRREIVILDIIVISLSNLFRSVGCVSEECDCDILECSKNLLSEDLFSNKVKHRHPIVVDCITMIQIRVDFACKSDICLELWCLSSQIKCEFLELVHYVNTIQARRIRCVYNFHLDIVEIRFINLCDIHIIRDYISAKEVVHSDIIAALVDTSGNNPIIERN